MNQFCALVLSLNFCVSAAWAERSEEKWERFRSGGRPIAVETFSPVGGGRYPAILVLHSSAGTLIGKGELVRFCRALARQGFVAFLVHYFDRTGTKLAGDGAIENLSDVWVETVKDAVDFATRHPRVRSGELGLFGYSLGAYIAVAESSLDPRIDAIVEIAGGIFGGFAPRMRRMPPTLILHGRRDQRVPVARAFELRRKAHALGADVQLKIYEGEGHRLSKTAAKDASQRAEDFFSSHFLRH